MPSAQEIDAFEKKLAGEKRQVEELRRALIFLSEITVCGAPPVIHPDLRLLQWNVAGFNFGDRCFQAVLRQDDKGVLKEVIIQVLRRSLTGGSNGSYRWVPLGSYPYVETKDLRGKVMRLIHRWMGAGEVPEGIPYNTPLHYGEHYEYPVDSFKVWLEGLNSPVDLPDLIKAHFDAEDLNQKLDTSKISSFLSLPHLRDLLDDGQIRSVKEAIEAMSKKKLRDLTLRWLRELLKGEPQE